MICIRSFVLQQISLNFLLNEKWFLWPEWQTAVSEWPDDKWTSWAFKRRRCRLSIIFQKHSARLDNGIQYGDVWKRKKKIPFWHHTELQNSWWLIFVLLPSTSNRISEVEDLERKGKHKSQLKKTSVELILSLAGMERLKLNWFLYKSQ